jgi:hypothetical protein
VTKLEEAKKLRSVATPVDGGVQLRLAEARDYERPSETLAGLRFVIFSVLMLVDFANLMKNSQRTLIADPRNRLNGFTARWATLKRCSVTFTLKLNNCNSACCLA